MSLESDRRAIGTNNESARRAIGARLTADRKAIAAGMAASRASTFKRDLNALESSPRRTVELTRREEKGTRPATVGRGTYVAPPSTGGGGGIASPLAEDTVVVDGKTMPDREWWIDGYTSSDGLFVLPAVKTLNLSDADSVPLVIQLANPQGVPI